ncbi:MAG: hypothetical protein EBZ07_05965 [Verrucomicrobia bacterium]|nr:hypothetical protein [Verrucomicrobiota bacterium]
MAKYTSVIVATPDQVDRFGKATDQLNQARKVREDLIDKVFKPAADSGNTHWAGLRYQITASEKSVGRLDPEKLIEELQRRGITDANVLVESCRTSSHVVSFRSSILVGRLAHLVDQRAAIAA